MFLMAAKREKMELLSKERSGFKQQQTHNFTEIYNILSFYNVSFPLGLFVSEVKIGRWIVIISHFSMGHIY